MTRYSKTFITLLMALFTFTLALDSIAGGKGSKGRRYEDTTTAITTPVTKTPAPTNFIEMVICSSLYFFTHIDLISLGTMSLVSHIFEGVVKAYVPHIFSIPDNFVRLRFESVLPGRDPDDDYPYQDSIEVDRFVFVCDLKELLAPRVGIPALWMKLHWNMKTLYNCRRLTHYGIAGTVDLEITMQSDGLQ